MHMQGGGSRLVSIVFVGPTLLVWVHSVIAVVIFALVTGHVCHVWSELHSKINKAKTN